MSKKEKIIITTAIILFALLIVFVFWYGKTHKKPDPVPENRGNMVVDLTATDEERKNDNPLVSRQVYFAGIEDATVDKSGVVKLDNLPDNKEFVMKYEIYNVTDGKNDKVFETDLIPSGKHVFWTPSEQLEPGTYKIAFVEIPYAPAGDDYTPLTQGRNVIQLTIVDQ